MDSSVAEDLGFVLRDMQLEAGSRFELDAGQRAIRWGCDADQCLGEMDVAGVGMDEEGSFVLEVFTPCDRLFGRSVGDVEPAVDMGVGLERGQAFQKLVEIPTVPWRQCAARKSHADDNGGCLHEQKAQRFLGAKCRCVHDVPF